MRREHFIPGFLDFESHVLRSDDVAQAADASGARRDRAACSRSCLALLSASVGDRQVPSEGLQLLRFVIALRATNHRSVQLALCFGQCGGRTPAAGPMRASIRVRSVTSFPSRSRMRKPPRIRTPAPYPMAEQRHWGKRSVIGVNAASDDSNSSSAIVVKALHLARSRWFLDDLSEMFALRMSQDAGEFHDQRHADP